MDIPTLKMDDITQRQAYDALVARIAGDELLGLLTAQRHACEALQSALAVAQRPLFLAYADAVADAAALREEATTQAALTFGAALGAVLAAFPEAPPDAVVDTAAGVLSAVLGANFPEAAAVARRTVEVLARLPLARVETADVG